MALNATPFEAPRKPLPKGLASPFELLNLIRNRNRNRNLSRIRRILARSLKKLPRRRRIFLLQLPLAKNGEAGGYHRNPDLRVGRPTQALISLSSFAACGNGSNTIQRSGKRRKGIGRFIVSWLAREQDRGGVQAHAARMLRPTQAERLEKEGNHMTDIKAMLAAHARCCRHEAERRRLSTRVSQTEKGGP